jgi:hypothetical protein
MTSNDDLYWKKFKESITPFENTAQSGFHKKKYSKIKSNPTPSSARPFLDAVEPILSFEEIMRGGVFIKKDTSLKSLDGMIQEEIQGELRDFDYKHKKHLIQWRKKNPWKESFNKEYRFIDLHGMTLEKAFHLLEQQLEFFHRVQRRNIMVITGKAKGVVFEDTLRYHVPRWLSHPPLKKYIQSLDKAPETLGGEGALVVRLKRS